MALAMYALTPRTLATRVLLGLLVAIACAAIGWGLAARSTPILLLVGMLAAIALLAIFAEAGLTTLWLWAPLSVAAYPLDRYLPASPTVTFDHLWIGGMVVLLAVMPLAGRMSRPTRQLVIALLVLTLVFGIRALLTGEHRLNALRTWIDAFVLPLILFAVVRRAVLARPGLTGRIALTLVIAGAILGAIGIGEHLFGFELATLSGSKPRLESALGTVRVSGPYDVPEVYGLSLVLCLAATMYWIQLRGRAVYATGVAIVTLEVLGIAFTLFRVAWVGAVIVIVVALAFRPRQYGRAVLVVAGMGLVLAVALTQLEHVQAFSQRAGDTQNFSSRLGSYDQGIEIFKQKPVFGVGFGRYNAVAETLPTVQVSGVDSEPYPHSSFVEALAEAGAIGLLALLAATASIWRLVRALNRRRSVRADALLAASLAGAAVGFLLFSLTLQMLPYGPSAAFFAVLLGMAAGRIDHIDAHPAAPPAEPADQVSNTTWPPPSSRAQASVGA